MHMQTFLFFLIYPPRTTDLEDTCSDFQVTKSDNIT